MLDGTAFEAEAVRAADSIRGVKKAAEEVNAVNAEQNAGGLLGFLGAGEKRLDSMNKSLDSFARKSLHVARQTASFSAGAGFGIYESVKMNVETEGFMRLLETQGHASRKQREELEGALPNFAKLGVGPKEAADALYPIQSVLHNVTEDEKALEAAAMGAAIGHDTLAHSASALISFWKDGHIGVKSYREEMALLDETVGAGKMHLPELSDVASTGLFQTTGTYGINQRAVLSLLAGITPGLSEGGVVTIAQRLKTALTKSIDLKGEALRSAKQLGLGKYTLAEDVRSGPEGLIKMLKALEARRSSLGQNVWQEDIANMFGGSRSAAAILTALKARPDIEHDSKLLGKVHGEGTLQEHFLQTSETSAFQLKKLRAEGEVLEKTLGKLFTPVVMKGITDLVGIFSGLTKAFEALPGPAKDGITYMLIFSALLSPLAFMASGVSTVLKLAMIPALRILFGAASETATVALPGLALGFEGLGGALGGVAPMLAVGGALYLGLEGINRLLGGQKTVLSEAVEGWKGFFNTLLGVNLGEGSKAEKHHLALDQNKKKYEANRLVEEHRLGNRPFLHPKNFAQKLADEGAEAEAAGSKQTVKIEIHSHLHVGTQEFGHAVLEHTPMKELTEKIERVQRGHEARR
jgi:hypothetical protein